MLSHNLRLVSFNTGFQNATLVVRAAFVGAVFSQMDLDAGDVTAVTTQGGLNFASGPSRQRLVTFDVMVGIDLDLHGFILGEEKNKPELN